MKRFAVFAALMLCALAAHAQQPLNVWIKLPSVISTDGIVSGTTNLPDGTILSIGIFGPPGSAFNRDASCDAMTGITVAVSHGAFGPIGLGGTYGCLTPGAYSYLVIMRAPFMQPPSVIAVIGKNGSNLTGHLVKESNIDRNVQATISVAVHE